MNQTLQRDEFFGHRVSTRNIGPFSLSLTRYDRGAVIPWHAHREPYATVVVSGAYREETAAGSRDCGTRDIIVHARDEQHADSFLHGNATCLNVHGMAFDRSALLSRSQTSVLAMKLVDEFRHPDALSPMAVESLMLELFVTTVRHAEMPGAPQWLAGVRRTLHERFQEPLTLADLGRGVDIHPGHLARAFRQHYGTTVGGMLRELRVAYAKQRLASAAPLREIALDAGFADQSHLTRTFKRSTGLTPAAFRRALR
jgi:AraC-like DNA-binding protein